MEMANVLGTHPLKRVAGPSVRRMLRRRGGKERTDGEGCSGGRTLPTISAPDADAEILVETISSEQCDGFQSRFTLASSMTRVFTTSNGVVAAAAMPPATDPHRAASYEVGRLPPR